jgi:DNA polymerase-3 subunit alpha
MDGVATPEEYIDRAVELGMPALAITDHGTLSGHRELYRIAKAKGIKPILGIEGYLALDRHDKRDKSERVGPLDVNFFHIVLLAKNQEGLENLNKLNEIAWTDGFYRKPRIDFEVLDQYGDGLIVLSACQGGLIAKAIENEEYAFAKEKVQWFKNRFKDDFYIELMPHNPKNINDELIALAKAFDVKVVVTPDCHHVDTSQKEIQEMMLLLNTHGKVLKDSTFDKSKKIENMMERLDYLYGEDRQMSFRSFDIHLLSYEEMKSAMAEQGHTDEEMFVSSIEIADKVEDYDIKSGLDLLPVQYKNPMKELKTLAIQGLT